MLLNDSVMFYVKCLFFCSLRYWNAQATDRYPMQFSQCYNLYVIFNPERINVQGKRGS